MKSLFVLFSLFVSLAHAETQTFGEEFKSGKTHTMSEVLADAEKFEKQPVAISAQVHKVCQKKGCWFEVKNSDKSTTRVVFKDYSFFVPKDIAGKAILMHGQLKAKNLSVKEQRHFLKDGGASKKEINAITKSKKVYQFVASGVEI